MLSVLPLAGWAQEEENEDANELHVFRGGYMDVNFGLNVNTVGSSWVPAVWVGLFLLEFRMEH